MAKEPLLFASPFPPLQTGIADFAAVLAAEMGRRFDVTLLVEDRRSIHPEGFEVLGYRNDLVDWNRYPHRLYHIGNDPRYHRYIYECSLQHPGVVILHEPVLYYLYVGYYRDQLDFYRRVWESEGSFGLAMIKRMMKEGRDLLDFEAPRLLPFNRELIHSGNTFLTHSEHARDYVLARAEGPVVVEKVNQAAPPRREWSAVDRLAARARLGIAADAVVLASFGFVAPTKQNDVVCRAVHRVNAGRVDKLHYIMVGDGSYVNDLLSDLVRVTGYVSAAVYEDYLNACDLVFNLRYPSMGETSAAALRAMRAGRPCVVTNDGWFAELPPGVAVKIEPAPPEVTEEVVCELIQMFLENREAFAALGACAAAYTAAEHNVERVASEIAAHILARSRLVANSEVLIQSEE